MKILYEDEVGVSDFEFEPEREILRALNATLEECGIDNSDINFEVDVVLTDIDGIQEVNKSTRNIDSPTDVLSFPCLDMELIEYLRDGAVPSDKLLTALNIDDEAVMLGDIMLCYDKIIEQAKEYGHSVKREFVFLVVHSMLHLLGYDHMVDEDMTTMEEKQHNIMDTLNIPR